MTANSPPPRFMIDHMLIKLGKYLRILGYEAEWDLRLRTHELIQRANVENRIFVTRNRRLPSQYPSPRRLILLDATAPVEQLDALVADLHLDRHAGLFTKCIRCNVVLDKIPDKAAIRDRVHPNVYARFDRFYTCPGCGTVFWKGSHVRNTCAKLGIEPIPPQSPSVESGPRPQGGPDQELGCPPSGDSCTTV